MSEIYDVPYIERTRDYYRAQGYRKDYVWAHNIETPFAPLPKPLRECNAGLIVTAMPNTEEGRTHRRVYSMLSSPIPKTMYTSELSWHQSVTHTDDIGSFLPLEQLNKLVGEARWGILRADFIQCQQNTVNATPLIKMLQTYLIVVKRMKLMWPYWSLYDLFATRP